MEIETTTDHHEHLLNDKENSEIARIQQFMKGNTVKWPGTRTLQDVFVIIRESRKSNVMEHIFREK